MRPWSACVAFLLLPLVAAPGLTGCGGSGGGTATCGITLSGRMLCWGLNTFGQLGFAPGDP